MRVSLVPQWSGLDLNQPGLDSDVIDQDRYGLKVVLLTSEDSARPQIIEALRNALKSENSNK